MLCLLSLTSVALLSLIAFGYYLQPMQSDLVRTGGYAAREYGWNQAQQAFKRPLYASDHYDHYYDIAVIGDSFSDLARPYQWQNYLAAASVHSVVSFSFRRGMRLPLLLAEPVFQQHPPKLLVYELAERHLLDLLDLQKPCVLSNTNQSKPSSIYLNNIPQPINWPHYLAGHIRWITRDTAFNVDNIEELISHAKHYFWRNLLRDYFEIESTNTRRYQLNRPAPFSSLQKQHLLSFEGDLNKQLWREQHLAQIQCVLLATQQQVEATHKTRFVVLIAPDKLSAYASFLLDTDLQDLSVIGKLAQQLPHLIPRVDLKLQAAIHAGELDIYLPDDTHWGWRGHQLAAETLINFLRPSSAPLP